CLLVLGLLGCVPKEGLVSPASAEADGAAAADAATPLGAAPETPATEPLDLTPVPFEVARARFVQETSARYGMPAAEIEAVLARAKFLDSVVAAMSRPAERVKPWH